MEGCGDGGAHETRVAAGAGQGAGVAPGGRPVPPPIAEQELEPSAPPEEYRLVDPLMSEPLVPGGTYYLVSSRWYIEWKQWVGHPDMRSPKITALAEPLHLDSINMESLGSISSLDGVNPPKRNRTCSWTKDRPGPIDNSVLLEEGSSSPSLRRRIHENSDYLIVPEAAWNMLHKWYGGGPEIKRRAIRVPSGAVQLELYGVNLTVYRSSDVSTETPAVFNESKCTLVGDAKRSICASLGLDPAKVRIWDYFDRKRSANLEDRLTETLEACRIEDQALLLEEQAAGGSWPFDAKDTSPAVGACAGTVTPPGAVCGFGGSGLPAATDPSLRRGVVGLQNLGNTCFMNSSLQCLSNVPELRNYFISDEYCKDINESAYKTEGKLAQSYADLMKQMWAGDVSKIAPRDFKWQIGQFAEQFSGYGQQDSMELVEYVVDGLKEDTNRVKKKPYVEVKEADGREDAVVAREAMENYRKRNDSLIDDLFVGLFKSVVRCPETDACGRVSVTFDPFLSAKIPLASSEEQRLTVYEVTVVCARSTPERVDPVVQVEVKLSKEQSVRELVEAAAAKVPGVRAQCCVLVEVYDKKVYKFFEDNNNLESIRPEDFLLLSEVEDENVQGWQSRGYGYNYNNYNDNEGESPTSGDTCGIIVYHRTKNESSYRFASLYGVPMLLSVPRKVTGRELNDMVLRKTQETVLQGAKMPPLTLSRLQKHHEHDEGEVILPESDEPICFSEPHVFLALDWDPESELPPRLKTEQHVVKRTSDPEVNLPDLLRMFVDEERLGADNTWYCSKCKEHKEAFKQLQFHHLPPVLVLQLKRFQYTRWSRERLNTPVRFPLEGLDMTPFCTSSSLASGTGPEAASRRVYDLVGLSKHIGGLGGGHYIASCRSSLDGAWYEYDDSWTKKITPQDVEQERVGAYVLFYLRRDRRPASFGPPQPGC